MPVDPVQITTIYKIMMNTLLVSIPEEIYFVLFTYIMMGEFDQWMYGDCKKLFQPWDYPRILVPAVSAALVSNILLYTGADMSIISLVIILVLFAGIVAMGDILNNAAALRWMGKALIYLLFAALFLTFCEFLYIPFFLYGTGMTVAELNNDTLLKFLISLPGRVMEYSLIVYLVAHKRSLLKARLLKMVFESKALTALTLGALLTDACFMIFMARLVGNERALAAFSAEVRFAVILGICLFPPVNLATLVGCTYFVHNRAAAQKKEAADRIRKIVKVVKTCAENGSTVNVFWKLNGLYTGLEGVANDLYQQKGLNKKGGER